MPTPSICDVYVFNIHIISLLKYLLLLYSDIFYMHIII